MMMSTLLHWKRRPLIYSFIITIGLGILLYIIENGQPQYYLMATLSLSLLFMLELISTIYLSQKLLEQYKLPPLENNNHFANLVQHFVLPITSYLAIVAFLFFYQYIQLKYILIGLSFFLFWILFTNIKAFYEDKFKIELRTHYIYDLISIIAYFGLYDAILNASEYFALPAIYKFTLITLMYLVFSFTVLIRLHVLDLYKLLIPLWIFNIGTLLFFISSNLTNIKTAFLSTLIYYSFIAYANHHKENTKSMQVFEEYAVLIFIAIVLLIFN